MTPKFDAFIDQILTESSKCTGPTLRQLSNKPEYRWMACRANPYSAGFKRVYWNRRGEKFDVRKCKRARPGSSNYEMCKDILRAVKRKLRRKKREAK